MESPSNLVETLFESVETYSKTTIELVKLKSMEQTANLVAPWISSLVIWGLLFAFGIALSIGIALWLGEIMGKLYYGFFIVASFYLFVILVIRVFLYHWIRVRITHSISSSFLH